MGVAVAVSCCSVLTFVWHMSRQSCSRPSELIQLWLSSPRAARPIGLRLGAGPSSVLKTEQLWVDTLYLAIVSHPPALAMASDCGEKLVVPCSPLIYGII